MAAMSQAQEFRNANAAYFFADAHFLVEAEASTQAKEIRHNVFQFPDGSVLVIDNHSFQTAAYDARPA
jgi:hypothetical protein